ncbi:hypothetical protein CRG98_047122 [Punica granatum]|uniref:Disease resistance protein At4g27190-like leucine-rich repeats domain-containing protein n=1 Tax=Punica granatum TaxID=22663 RepID=A0A2I0HLD2_PUNGR|nr:hypothetical protein CRG98_047122 [Punica granatum]
MYRLSNLDILIPDVDMLREDLQFFWKLDKYRVLIGDKWKWSEICKGQRTLMVTLKGNDILSEEWLQLTLRRTEDLHLHGSDGTKRSIHGLCREGFKELKHLHVERSPSTHYLVRSTKCAAESAFIVLESLFLENLSNLEKICHGLPAKGIWQDQHSVEWSKLKYLRIEACRNLLKVVDSSKLIMKLESLESLSIKDCKSIEEVFDFRGVAIGTVNKILPRLHALELEDLPSLRCLWNTTSPEELSGFRNLGSLKVDGCSGLRCLFTAPMVKAMATLKELEVSNCGNMETIVMEDSEDASKRSWFSSSKVLKAAVECPGSLMFGPSSFSSKHVDGDKVEGTTKKAKDTAENIIAFPSLRMLNIHDCYIMKSFVLSCKREQEAPMMAGDDSSDSKSKDDSHAVFFNTKVSIYIHAVFKY